MRMLGGGEPDQKTGKEPLLADETVPLEFLPSDESGGKSKRFGVVLTTTVAVALLAAIGIGASQDEAVWAPELEPFVEFVEAERGLEFLRPVGFIEITRAPESAPISRENRCQTPGLDCPETEAFRLLGVNSLDPAAYTDIHALVEFFDAGGQVQRRPAAFFEAFGPGRPARIVFVNGDLYPDELRPQIIVHELVHALQDQHNLLSDRSLDTDEGRINLAITEGDATRIESAYVAQLSPTERAAAEEASREFAQMATEARFAEPVGFYTDTTYALGEAFTKAFLAHNGQVELDDQLDNPTYVSNDVFVDILGTDVQPTVDATEIINLPDSVDEADGRIGAIGWFVVLAPLVGVDQAFDAVIGYDDDAWAIYDNPDVQRTSPLRTCLRSDIFFDSGDEAAEFVGIIEVLPFRIEVDESRQSVTLDICDELGDADLQTPAVMIPIIAANHLAAHHLDNGETTDAARCAALDQAKTIPIDLTFDDFTGYGTFIDDADGFVQDCR